VIILAIETSTRDGSIALNDTERQLGGRADQTLMPAILSLCADEGIGLSSLEGVAVGVGPGMFTSMRAGIATAKTLAMSLGIPILGVPSLDTLAAGATGERIVARIEAGRAEVYEATYRALPFERMSDISIVPREPAPTGVTVAEGTPRASIVLQLARDRFEGVEPLTLDQLTLEPLYVRRTDAEIDWERRGTSVKASGG